MKPETLALLMAADHPTACEAPAGFQWHREMARVRELQPRVEKLLGCPVMLDENVQDASFFTQLLCSHFSIKFSAFGNLFTIWSDDELERDLEDKISRAVGNEKFVYVADYELGEVYTGENKLIQRYNPDRTITWFYRYFEYL